MKQRSKQNFFSTLDSFYFFPTVPVINTRAISI
jgi:hypothetical protein